MGLGSFPLLSLANARNPADEIAGLVSLGKDPIAEKAERARAVTVAAL